MTKTCLECGYEIVGRSDKRFCSDQCRSAYNNRINTEMLQCIRNTNNILKKNRRILSQLNQEGKTKVHKERLLDLGFRFEYMTERYITRKGTTYYFCYEQGYLPLDNNWFILVKKNLKKEENASEIVE